MCAMSSTTGQLHGGPPNLANPYLLSNVDSGASSSFSSATSTLISNEIINQAAANSCSSYSSSYVNETQMYNSASAAATMMPHSIDALRQHSSGMSHSGGGSYKKKKKKHHRSDRGKSHSGEANLAPHPPGLSSVYNSAPGALPHQYQHHYVQQTERIVISTRKLSLVESVCPMPQSGQFHPNVGAQSSCNTNYHHSAGVSFGGKPQAATAMGDSYAMSQSAAAISTLLNQASTASSLNLHCQNEMATLTHQNIVASSGGGQRKKNKKKKRHRKEAPKRLTSANSSSQHFSSSSNNLCLSGADFSNERPGKVALCDSLNRLPSRSHSSSSSSSSSSDSEREELSRTNPNMAYNNYRRKVKQKKNSSFSSSTTNSSSSSSSSSSSTSSSSYSSSSSSDDDNEANSSAASSASSSSSSSSSSRSSSSSKSSDSCDEANDVLNKISVKSNEEVTEQRNYVYNDDTGSAAIVKYEQTNEVGANVAPSQVKEDVNQIEHHQFASSTTSSASFHSSAFSMDTLLHQQQQQQTSESTVDTSVKENLQSVTSSAVCSQSSSITPLSYSKQNTPLSSTILSDDCNSIESPLSVESSGKESGKDELLKSGLNQLKRRDPVEERQRLRSYRIPHHLTSNRSTLAKSTEATTTCTTTTTVTTTVPTTTAVTSSTSTTVVTTKAAIGSSIKSPSSESSSLTSTRSTVVTSSAAQPNKKDRTPTKVTQAESNKPGSISSSSNSNNQSKKPIAIVSSNTSKVTNSVLAPSPQTSSFLNSSFFLPGSTPAFPYPQPYPFSSAFMPALFQNQFLNNVTSAAVSKATSSSQSPQTRFLHPSPSQSQLTILTSPTPGPHALSPFFQNLSPSALLSPKFSSSALSNSGITTPLLVPQSLNFSPNFSFAPGSIDPGLMMLSIANSNNKTSASSSTATTSSTHHTPPFILPRIVSTSTAVSSTGTMSKSSPSALAKSERAISNTSQIKPLPIKSSLIISTTSSACSMVTNAQHSPMSTILHPQTLLLLQPPIASTFAGKGAIVSSHNSTVAMGKNSTISATDSLASLAPTKLTVSTSMAALNPGKPLISSTMSPSIQRSTLPGGFIFSSNSSHQQLPYTLFSQTHPQALMQPISIQAPPPPTPSSILGTQLLLSVIPSPTHRNPLTAPIGTQNKLPLPSSNTFTSNTSSSANSILTNVKLPLAGTLNKPGITENVVKSTAGVKTEIKVESSTVPLITITPSSMFTKSKSTSTSTVQAPKQTGVSSTGTGGKFASGKSTIPTSTKDLFPTLNVNFYKDTGSTNVPKASEQYNKTLALSKHSGKSPDVIIASPNTVAGADEFESLVRSVNDQIQSFHSSSELDDYDLSPRKAIGHHHDSAADSFNSKKMLSLMIKSGASPKTPAEIGDALRSGRAKLLAKDKAKCSSESSHELVTKKSMTPDLMAHRAAAVGTSMINSKLDVREKTRSSNTAADTTRKQCDQKAASKEVAPNPVKSSSSKSSGKRKHKERRKAKGKDGKSSLRKLDKKSTSRHKSRSKKARSQTIKSLHKDPALMAQIESVITKFEALRLSTTKVTLWSAGGTPALPPMFRVSFPKTTTTTSGTSKLVSRSARFSGQRGSKQSECQQTQCLLPLKKRHPRNPDDSNSTNSGSTHSSSVSVKSGDHRDLHHQTTRVRHQENEPSSTAARPEASSQINSAKLTGTVAKKPPRKRSSSRTSQCEVPARGTQTEDHQQHASGAAPGPAAFNLNASSVAPPGDRSSCQKAVSVPAAAAATVTRKQQHGAVVVATVDAANQHSHHHAQGSSGSCRQQREHGCTTVSSETIATAPRTPLPQLLPPATTSTATSTNTTSIQTSHSSLPNQGPDADPDAPQPTKQTRGRKKKSSSQSACKVAKAPLVARVSSPILRSSSSASHHTHAAAPSRSHLTSDLKVPKSAKPSPNATTTTNYSSLDEPSDADDEFDSDDEKPSTKHKLVLSTFASTPAEHSHARTCSPNQLRETDSRKMAKAPKSVRVNGVTKSTTTNGKSSSASATTQPNTKKDNQTVDTKKRNAKATTDLNHVNGNLNPTSAVKSIKDGKVKKKRRRAVNRTGFDKPRKRNKTVNSAKGKSSLTNEIAAAAAAAVATKPATNKSHAKALPQSNHVNGHSSQSEDEVGKRKKLIPIKRVNKTKTNGESEASSTEIDELVVSSRNKSKSSKNKCLVPKLKATQKRKKMLVKSESSDSDKGQASLLTSSGASSQDEEDNESENIPLSVDDYPIYMVTKPSRKATKSAHKKKVHLIKSNPFIRSIPSKKYYKVGLYAKEFAQLHPEEPLTAKPLVKADTVESQSESDDLPIIPLPSFFAPHELISTSSSSCSSSLEDEESSDARTSRKKLPKRQKPVKLKDSRQLAPNKPVLDESGFTLSFDIWYQYKFNPLPTAMSSANYRRVRTNVFVDMKPVAKHSHQSCNCSVPKHGSACGPDCINRLMYQECWPQTCPAKKVCSNQRIQRYEWSPGLERFMTDKRGWGIRTTEQIKTGEFILEYIGEIVSDELFKKRMTERYGNDQHHYSLKIDAGMVIDGYRVANEGRFVNHSCEPNCEMQKWAVNGYYRVCMFALRDIKPNEELFYDYNFHNFNLDSQQTCHCGSSKCRGFIGGKRANNTKSSAQTDTASSNSPDVNNSNENSKDAPNAVSNVTRFCKALSLCTGEESWNDSQMTISKNSHKRIRKDNFCFVNCKTKGVNVKTANVTDILPAKSNLRKPLPATNSSLEVLYDPNLLSTLKVKPPSHSVQTTIRKGGIFLLRNYRNTRSYLSLISNAVNGKTDVKTEQNPYLKQKTNYRNSPTHMNGHSSSESDSNSDSNSKSLLSCKSIGKGLLAAIENDKLTVHSMIKHTQIFNDICTKIRALVRQKLILMLQAEDNLIKPTNGDRAIQNGSLKRPYNNDNFETAFAAGFCSFKPIYELIKTTPFMRVQFFESEMSKYIQKQLQTLIEFPGDKVLFKRMKLNHSTNFTDNDMKNLMYGDTAIFSQRQIKSLEKSILMSLECALKERKCDIEDIVKKISNSDFDNSCLSLSVIIKHLNKLENNNLSEMSKRKMSLFSKNLLKVQLSDIFNFNEPSIFDFVSSIDKEVYNSVVTTFNNSPLNELALRSSPTPAKQTETEEVIRCICGSMREEGQMIQCDQCQVWQHFECVQQFSHISDLEDSEYHCEKCESRSVPLDVPYPNHIPNFIEAAKELLPSMKYYRSLESPVVKGLQIKLGDCVYIYRKSDSKIGLLQPSQANKKSQKRSKLTQNAEPVSTELTKKTFIDSLKGAAATAVKNLEHTFDRRECIIIRVEHLAVIESTNQRILYGYHYLWPEETYHEPSRKFYTNEVLQSPNQEWAALDEVRGLCCVLDPATYCKGRPKAFQSNDIFICEYRVDRFAKQFAKRKKFNYPICTKSYAFDLYESKLKPKRTYSPHHLPENDKPLKGKSDQINSKQNAKNLCDKDDPAYKEKLKNIKMANLRIIANKLNESAYFWYLLLEQEQDNKGDLDMMTD